MKNEILLQDLLDSYDNSIYPQAFLDEYDMMECLSERGGVVTFLVQDEPGNRFIAKCYDRSMYDIPGKNILEELDCHGIPHQTACFGNETMTVIVREYLEGVSLDHYAKEQDLSEQDIVKICIQLCDILAYLHHREAPVIHRDIKPQNIIVGPEGDVSLIDFDIARVYQSDNDTDTRFFGTRDYASPEQYGFSQTDARTDIYAVGILLRWLLTRSTKANPNVKIYGPLDKIINKAAAFSPEERYPDISLMKKALEQANPRAQRIRVARLVCCGLLFAVLLVFGGVKLYQYVTYSPFKGDVIPAYMSDEERIKEAVSYMKEKYGTDMFEPTDDVATVGHLRAAMIDLYGLDRDYVYGINEDVPQESDAYFLPWGWDDGQNLSRDVAVYATVKVHDPTIVADWSSLKDDNGFYPGLRVAVAFAEDTGILTGANQPDDISLGELALILANGDKVFDAAKTKQKE